MRLCVSANSPSGCVAVVVHVLTDGEVEDIAVEEEIVDTIKEDHMLELTGAVRSGINTVVV